MQGLVRGEPELAHEHDFDVENIIVKKAPPPLLYLLANSLA